MRNPLSRFMIPLMLAPLLLVAACSDDEGSQSQSAPASTGTASQSETSTVPATSSAVTLTGSVKVDFTGAPEELPAIDLAFEVEAGSTAWDAIKAALGEDNVAYRDFGGALGIFITGFSGVEAEGNSFWEFKINGETAEAGVSNYEVQQGDVLEFEYSRS